MAYIPTEWETGDVITAEKLNNMEQGIEDAALPKHIVDIVVDGSISNISLDTEYRFTGSDLTITGDTEGLHDEPTNTEIIVHFSPTYVFHLRFSEKYGSEHEMYRYFAVYSTSSNSGSALSMIGSVMCDYDKLEDEILCVIYTFPSVRCQGLNGKWSLVNTISGFGKWEGYCDVHTGTLQVAADFSSANLVTDYVPRNTTGAGVWPIDERFEVTVSVADTPMASIQLKSLNEVGSMYSGVMYNPLASAWILVWINYANDAWTAAIKVIS